MIFYPLLLRVNFLLLASVEVIFKHVFGSAMKRIGFELIDFVKLVKSELKVNDLCLDKFMDKWGEHYISM